MSSIETIVIVGVGLAGATAAETLRDEGFGFDSLSEVPALLSKHSEISANVEVTDRPRVDPPSTLPGDHDVRHDHQGDRPSRPP